MNSRARRTNAVVASGGTVSSSSFAIIGAAVDTAFGLTAGSTQPTSATVSATSTRKRRGFGLARQRRGIIAILITIVTFNQSKCSTKCGKGHFQNFPTFTCTIIGIKLLYTDGTDAIFDFINASGSIIIITTGSSSSTGTTSNVNG